MIPAFLIPLVIQLGSKLIDLAFDQVQKLPPENKSKVLDKIEEQDRKNVEKMEQPDDDY